MNKRTFWQLLKRFFEPVFSYPLIYGGSIFVSATFFFFDIYTVLTLQSLATSFQDWNVGHIPKRLSIYAIVVVIMYIRKRIIRNQWRVLNKRFSAKYLFDLYFQKYIKLNNTDVEKVWVWRLMSIIKDWVFYQLDSINLLSYSITDLLIKTSFTVYLLSSMWTVYVLWFLAFIVISFWLVTYIDWFANTWRRARKSLEEKFSRLFVRVLQSKMEIVSSNSIDIERKKNNDLRDEMLIYNKDINKYIRWMFNIPLLLVTWLVLVIMYYSYYSYQTWTFDFGEFTGLVAMTWYLNQLMLNLSKKFQDLTKNYTHIERLWNFFDTTPEFWSLHEWEKFIYKTWDIALENISFSYSDDEEKVFNSFSLTISWWNKTAFVWVSGSGKSTLAKLVAWYLLPDSWSINIDGQNLEKIALQSYYEHIWYLTQEPSIFDGTVWENLTYAVSNDVSEDSDSQEVLLQKVKKAIENAKCDFVFDFKDWLQTEIWERGIRLSGWQRQRLAIAKIFLKDPEIIILDEPTSALDSFSEEWITQAMNNLFTWRTVIIIAHRLQTVKKADDIILFEGGKVIERWTHHQLLKKWGQYAKMLELQSWF